MIINTAGEYTLQYTATDACGNSTTVERELTVEEPPTYRTVLYTDGTFIINESSRDEADNIAQHGVATNVYAPFDPNGATDVDKYIFTQFQQRPWYTIVSNILSVEIGSPIKPVSTAYWFYSFKNATNYNLGNLNTELVTSMEYMFYFCNYDYLDFSSFDTSNVTNMKRMFQYVKGTGTLDISSFNTSNVTNMEGMFIMNPSANDAPKVIDISNIDTSNVLDMSSMFRNNQVLTTVYASPNFSTAQVTNSANMFDYMTSHFEGGAGTVWNSSNPRDKTYARIDNPPSAPGYFTAKS